MLYHEIYTKFCIGSQSLQADFNHAEVTESLKTSTADIFESDRKFFITLNFDIMAYSSPWTPELNKTKCAPCASYDESVREAVPNSIQHPAWAKRKLSAELGKTPEARDALWESILMLWRLNMITERSHKDLNWQKLVSAWLVCVHRLLIATETDDV
jgi:hypothetical protein